jgi:hypothetical protein
LYKHVKASSDEGESNKKGIKNQTIVMKILGYKKKERSYMYNESKMIGSTSHSMNNNNNNTGRRKKKNKEKKHHIYQYQEIILCRRLNTMKYWLNKCESLRKLDSL